MSFISSTGWLFGSHSKRRSPKEPAPVFGLLLIVPRHLPQFGTLGQLPIITNRNIPHQRWPPSRRFPRSLRFACVVTGSTTRQSIRTLIELFLNKTMRAKSSTSQRKWR
jgi:hypothetical protein